MTIRRPGSLLIQNSDALCDRLLGHVPNGGVIYLHGVSCSGKSTLAAQVASEPIDGGMRYSVTGAGPVSDSIRRMLLAHAATLINDAAQNTE